MKHGTKMKAAAVARGVGAGEPDLSSLGPTVGMFDLVRAYNWYADNKEWEDARKYLLEFLKARKADPRIITALGNVNKVKFSPVGWAARLTTRGTILPAENMTWFNAKVKALVAEGWALQKEKSPAPDVASVARKLSVQDHMNAQVGSFIADLDEEIAKIAAGPVKESIAIADWLREKNVKPPQAKKLAEHYKPLSAEIKLHATDEQVQEAYRVLGRKQIAAMDEFVEDIIRRCDVHAAMGKATRKPRSKKVKSADQLVKRVKFCGSNDTFKVASVHPSNIIAAQELWVFNCKTRKLGCFRAKDAAGLSIKGTTVIDYNETESFAKKLRKPEKVLETVVGSGKVALRHVMTSIKAKVSPLKGRLNSDIILLRVVK